MKYKERDGKEHTRIPKLDARVSDDYHTDVCYELTMVEADDMSKSANPSPEFSNNRHYCTVNKHSLGPDLHLCWIQLIKRVPVQSVKKSKAVRPESSMVL